MREIKLTKGKVALVDDDDYERLNQYKWHVFFDGWNWYAQRNSPYVNGKRKQIKMHREILGASDMVKVDHINSNGLDNRKENLRIANHQQNMWNRKIQKNNTLKAKGVTARNRNKKFQSRITVDNKQIHLGNYTVLADADQAHRNAEIKYFGEFAREETKKLLGMCK